MSLLSFAWMQAIQVAVEAAQAAMGPVSTVAGVAKAMAPEDWKRRLKSFAKDFHSFFDKPSTNHDLVRALRIAWCDATIDLLEEASRQTRKSQEAAGERDVILRLSKELRWTLIGIRDQAWQRHVPVGTRPMDSVAKFVVGSVAEYVTGDLDDAQVPEELADIECRIADHLVETLPALVADRRSYGRGHASDFDYEKSEWHFSLPPVVERLAREGWTPREDAAPMLFGQRVLAEFAELMKGDAFPEAKAAFNIYLHEQTRRTVQELGDALRDIKLTLNELTVSVKSLRELARRVEDIHRWVRAPYRFSDVTAHEVEQRLDELVHRLYGRDADMAALDGRIERESSVTLLTGPGGVGKSALLATWVRRRHGLAAHVAYHFFSELSPDTRFVDQAWAQLAAQAALYHREEPAEGNPPASARDHLFELVQRDARPDLPLVVVMDGLDEADGEVLPLGPVRLGKHVHLIVGARADVGERPTYLVRWLDWLAPRHATLADAARLELGPLDRSGLAAWVAASYDERGATVPTGLAERIQTGSDGLALLAQLLLAEDPAKVAADTEDEDPDKVRGHVRKSLEAMLSPPDRATTEELRLLALLSIAKGPIDATELRRVVGSIYTVGLKAQVRRWLRIVGTSPHETFGFIHPRLAQAFSELLHEVDELRDDLLRHMRQWREHNGPYALRWLPEHLFDSATSSYQRELAELLGSPDFLLARLSKGDPSGWLVLALQEIEKCERLGAAARTDNGLQRMRAVINMVEPGLHPQIPFGRTTLGDIACQLTTTAIEALATKPTRSEGRLRRILSGHTGPVRGAHVLDGGRILSWSDDDTLRLWTADGAPNGPPLQGHTGPVVGAHVLDGGRILSWSQDGTLRRWTVDGAPDGPPLQGHTGPVWGAHVLDGGRILSWSDDGTLRRWTVDGTPDGAPLQGHIGSVMGARVLDGGRILSWSDDGTLRLWTADGAPHGPPLKGHTGHVQGAHVLDGGRILSWSQDGTLRLWTVDGAPHGPPLLGHTGRVLGAHLLDDGRILSWSEDNTLRLWTADGAPHGPPLQGHTGWCLDAHVDGGRILSWSSDGTLRLWTADGAPDGPPLQGHTGSVWGAHVLDGDRILSWSYDGTLRLWTADGAPDGPPLQGHTGSVWGAHVLDGDRILSWSYDGTLRLWTADGAPERPPLQGHTGQVLGAHVLDGDRILSWSDDRTLRLWTADGAPHGSSLQGHTGAVLGAHVLDRGRILSWSYDGTLRLWTADGVPLWHPLQGHTGPVLGAQVLDDDRILSWSYDRTLRLRRWTAEGASQWPVLQGHTGWVLGAHVLNGGRILSWSSDGTLRLWTADGTPDRHPLQGHTGWVLGAHMLNSGRILSWSRDGTLRLWTADGAPVEPPLQGHNGAVLGAHGLGDGRILSWSDDGTLRFWTTNGAPDGPPLHGHTGWVTGAHVLDGGRILSWSHDGTLRLWTADGAPDRLWVVPFGYQILDVTFDTLEETPSVLATDNRHVLRFYVIGRPDSRQR
jgi:WD40 repeat protein